MVRKLQKLGTMPTQSQTPGEPEQVKAPMEKEDVSMIKPSEEDIKGDFKSVDF